MLNTLKCLFDRLMSKMPAHKRLEGIVSQMADKLQEEQEALRVAEAYIVELTAQRNKLSRDCRDLQTGKITIKELAIRNGSLTAEMGTEVSAVLANQFCAVLDKAGAENYVEMQFVDSKEPDRKVAVIIQRFTSKSPHQLRMEAEKELEELRAKMNVLGC